MSSKKAFEKKVFFIKFRRNLKPLGRRIGESKIGTEKLFKVQFCRIYILRLGSLSQKTKVIFYCFQNYSKNKIFLFMFDTPNSQVTLRS